MVEGFEALGEAWDRHAEAWARWTRVPDTISTTSCSTGRLFVRSCRLRAKGRWTSAAARAAGRQLSAGGHRVAGIDSSATLVRLAREAGGYDELVCGDVAELPWKPKTFDLAVAYMSLHDMDDMTKAVDEIARGYSGTATQS